MMLQDVTAGNFIIDTRDVEALIIELESNVNNLDGADKETLKSLLALRSEFQDYSSEWEHGETLICEDYWIDYVRELCEDCGYIPKELPKWIDIDWESTAKNVAQDYVTINFDGVDYYARCI
jgi:hypothetical protein